MNPGDADRDPGQGGRPAGRWWRGWLGTFLTGILAGLIITLVGQWLVREVFHEDPPPRGTIDKPARAATVPAGSVAAGSLAEIPDDAHVWLVARRGNQVWPVGDELGHEPGWERRIPSQLPRGQALSLALLLLGGEGAERLHARLGRIHPLPARALGDFEALATVPRFFVGVEAQGSRLYSVFPQAGEDEAEAFRYENDDGLVNAELPDDPSCHRPSRSTGLRLEWRMSGKQSGGWGVAWDRTDAGSFDASGFDHLSLSVKGAVGGETFELALKDTAHEEQRVESTDLGDVTANGWGELSAPLTEFAPVDLGSLETLSIGFSQPNGEGEICIDEIKFAGAAAAEPKDGGEVESESEVTGERGHEAPPARGPISLEGGELEGDGEAMSRAHASGEGTLLLQSGESAARDFEANEATSYLARVRYSNYNYGPQETIRLEIDGAPLGEFESSDTGDWDAFTAASLGPIALDAGDHSLSVSVSGGDGYGIEIDRVRLVPEN